MKNGSRCSFKGCTNSRYNNQDSKLSFHKFPATDIERRNLWIKISGADFSHLTDKQICNKKLCSRHFKASDLSRQARGNQSLSSSAVPISKPVADNGVGNESPTKCPDKDKAFKTKISKIKALIRQEQKELDKLEKKYALQKTMLLRRRSKLNKITSKNARLKKSLHNKQVSENLSVGQILDYSKPFLTEPQLIFLSMQLKRTYRSYWNEREKLLSLSIYYKCGYKNYKVLKEKFNIPCLAMVKQWVNEFQLGNRNRK